MAEAAAESAAAPAAGVASVVAGAGSVLAASCFAQAVSISAAIRALRASLVFIDQYPERSKSGGGVIEFGPAIRYSRIAAQNSIELRCDLKYVSGAGDTMQGVRMPQMQRNLEHRALRKATRRLAPRSDVL